MEYSQPFRNSQRNFFFISFKNVFCSWLAIWKSASITIKFGFSRAFKWAIAHWKVEGTCKIFPLLEIESTVEVVQKLSATVQYHKALGADVAWKLSKFGIVLDCCHQKIRFLWPQPSLLIFFSSEVYVCCKNTSNQKAQVCFIIVIRDSHKPLICFKELS